MDNQLPTIIQQNKTSGLWPKLIFGFLGLVIVAEIIFGIKTLTKNATLVSLIGLRGGQIVLVPGQKQVKVGDNVNVLIRVATGGHNSVGSDVDIKYDPTFLEATSSANFYRGSIFDAYPIINVDNKKGDIKISAVTGVGRRSFEGVGILGGLNFKALKNGTTIIYVADKKGSTTTSTVVESGTARNILTSVQNLKLTIGSSSTNEIAVAKACYSRFQQQCIDQSNRLGTQWCTSILDNPTICKSGCYIDKTSNVLGCNVTVVSGHK